MKQELTTITAERKRRGSHYNDNNTHSLSLYVMLFLFCDWITLSLQHSECTDMHSVFFYFVSWFCDGMCSRNDSVWWLTTDHIAHSPPMSESIWFMLTPQMVLLSGVLFIIWIQCMMIHVGSHLISCPPPSSLTSIMSTAFVYVVVYSFCVE